MEESRENKITKENIFELAWIDSATCIADILSYSNFSLSKGAAVVKKVRNHDRKWVAAGGGHNRKIGCSSTIDDKGRKINDNCGFCIKVFCRQKKKNRKSDMTRQKIVPELWTIDESKSIIDHDINCTSPKTFSNSREALNLLKLHLPVKKDSEKYEKADFSPARVKAGIIFKSTGPDTPRNRKRQRKRILRIKRKTIKLLNQETSVPREKSYAALENLLQKFCQLNEGSTYAVDYEIEGDLKYFKRAFLCCGHYAKVYEICRMRISAIDAGMLPTHHSLLLLFS